MQILQMVAKLNEQINLLNDQLHHKQLKINFKIRKKFADETVNF